MDFDFSDILQKSRALRSQQEATASAFPESIARLERALPQIDAESRRLVSALGPQEHAGDDPRALRLLSEYGYETDKIERTLQSVALRDVFDPLPSVPDTDLDAFLASARQLSVAAAVQHSVRRARSLSLAALSTTLDAEWHAAKRELVTLNSLAAHAPTAAAPPPASAARYSSAAFASPFRNPRAARLSLPHPANNDASAAPAPALPPLPPHPHHSSRPAPPFQPVVRRLLHAHAPATPNIPLATHLDDALLLAHAPRADPAAASRNVQHLHATFVALRYIFDEPAPAPRPPRHFANLSAHQLAATVCRGAREYLCLQFREDKMRREIESRPIEARRGGVPGVRADVRAYLNLLFNRGVPDQLAHGPQLEHAPFWPQVYYCLRAGFVDEALNLVDDAVAAGVTDPSVLLFHKCLLKFVESATARTLPPQLLAELVQHYGVAVRRGPDPYQRACFVVIARVDPTAGDMVALQDADYSLLFYSIEDYLWLLMSIVRMDAQEKLTGALGAYSLPLSKVGEEMRKFGAKHFDPHGDTPMFYAFVLILTGQFLEAVQYLNSGARAVEEATHITLVLYHYGALRENTANPSSPDAVYQNQFTIDYAQLVWRYVSRFQKQDPVTAAVYLFTVREREVRNELLKKVLLETRAFDVLVGRPTAYRSNVSGERSGGLIADLWETGDSDDVAGRDGWVSVVVGAAELAEARGDRDCAILLYDVGGVAAKVVAMHIERLSAELTSRGSAGRAKALEAAQKYQTRLRTGTTGLLGGRRGAGAVSERATQSLNAMVGLCTFFDLRWDGRLEEAQRKLEEVGVLPRNESEVVAKLSELAHGSCVWESGVCDRVADVLLAGMEVLAEIYVGSRHGGGIMGSRVEQNGLRSWAKTLVNFSGMTRGLSADVSAKLVRFEVMMS